MPRHTVSPPPGRTWLKLLLVGAFATVAGLPGAAFAGSNSGGGRRDLGAEVRAVFEAKCASCHGAHLAKPRGKFGHVLDLPRVAANPKLVVPSLSDDSPLWKLIDEGEMPPEGARTGPLTTAEKELVRAWIDAGAPPPTASVVPAPSAPGTSTRDAVPPPARLLRWLGKLHVATVHFPIGLLLAAAVAELWALGRGALVPLPAVRFCVLLGAAGAAAAAVLGWLLAWGGYGAGSPGLLALHRWVGTATGLVAVGAAVLSEADARLGKRRRRSRLLLFLAALLVGIAGHLGGTLVHGEDFYDW
jgi:hypothetical protein